MKTEETRVEAESHALGDLGALREYKPTEDSIKALQSVGEIISELLKA